MAMLIPTSRLSQTPMSMTSLLWLGRSSEASTMVRAISPYKLMSLWASSISNSINTYSRISIIKPPSIKTLHHPKLPISPTSNSNLEIKATSWESPLKSSSQPSSHSLSIASGLSSINQNKPTKTNLQNNKNHRTNNNNDPPSQRFSLDNQITFNSFPNTQCLPLSQAYWHMESKYSLAYPSNNSKNLSNLS